MGFFGQTSIISDTCMAIPNGSLFHFGILTSEMHMAWVKYVCGRLESRFRYSKDIVYNNFPWPENPTEKQLKTVEEAAQKVLDVRKKYQETEDNEISSAHQTSSHQQISTSAHPPISTLAHQPIIPSLADLYDPLTMPPDLVKAHHELDKAVDLCYRPQPFINETKRIEFLFDLYDKYTAGLFAREKKKSNGKN